MSFPHFSRLPTELQLKIWRYMLPSPRVVDVFAITTDEKLEERLPPNSCTADPASTSWVQTFIECVYATPHSLPPLFHLCRAARRLVMQHYNPINAEMGVQGERELESLAPEVRGPGLEIVFSKSALKENQPYTLVNPSMDILYLNDAEWMNGTEPSRVSSLDTVVRWLGGDIKRNLRHLAIPYHIWNRAKNAGSMRVLVEFERLDELYVDLMILDTSLVMGSAILQTEEINWMGEVGERIGLLTEVIREDIENLARENPQWKRPEFRTVNRTLLMNELEM
jgi:hypothetical protein